MASRTLAARTLACGLGFGAEVPAFTFTMRGIREGQGLAQDWSAGGVSRDLLRTGIMLAFLKGAGVASRGLLDSPLQGGSAPAWLRFSHRALPQFFQYVGLMGAHGVEQYWRLSTPTAHPWVDSLVTLLHFNVVGRAMHAVSRPNPREPFGNGEVFQRFFHHAKEWLVQGRAQPELSTPEGLRIPSQIFSMSQDGGEGTGRPNPQAGKPEVLESQGSRGSEAEPKQVRYLPPMKFNPRHFEAVRDRYYSSGNGLYTLIDAQEGIPLWYFQFRTMGLQFQALARRVREGLEGHPDGEEILPVLRRIDQEMTEFNRLLLASPKAFPVVMTKSRIVDLASLLYPNPNVMVNFIHAGRRSEIEQVLRATVRARVHLQGMLEGLNTWGFPEPNDAQVSARDLIPGDAGQFNRQYPKYDFSDDITVLHHDIVGQGNSILLLGAESEFRPTVFTDQRATHFGMRFLRPGEGPELSRTLSGDAAAAPLASFDYLEAYDLLRPEVIRSPEGEAVMEFLASRLKPGGVGYLVYGDSQSLIGTAELLSRLQLGDIIEGSLGSRLPVASPRRDADYSNYLFFRRLPFK